MKTGILLFFMLGSVFSSLVAWRVVDQRDTEIAYYKLALSEISHDMEINYRLHKNAIGALKNIRSIPCKRSHK